MTVQIVEDPIGDPRWAALLDRHPNASVFHSPAWLEALRDTYGYRPFVVSTSRGERLDNGLLVCRVKTWISRRLVSLPFSDHCAPLIEHPDELEAMIAYLDDEVRRGAWRSLQLRPPGSLAARAVETDGRLQRDGAYWLHTINLQDDLQQIFRRMHPSNTRRAVRRAERERLTYATGRSEELLLQFFRLLRMARRRHGLPPQPLAWFRNLLACMGERSAIHVASKAGRPSASILTLSFKQTMFYKYGGSDVTYHHLGGMPFLFWRVIENARTRDFAELDLGRSEVDQPGLIAFKDHLGATRSTLTYYRHPARQHDVTRSHWVTRAGRGVIAHLPDAALDLAGRLLYKHSG